MMDETAIPRPHRWQTPFGAMSDADVARVLHLQPFASMNPARFTAPMTLEGIIRNDTRLVRFEDADIVVRAGDYGNSAFLILSGRLRVVLPPGLPSELLGRAQERDRSAWSILAQLWRNPRLPEVRDPSRYLDSGPLGQRSSGTGPRVFLQDMPTLMQRSQTSTMETGDIFGEIAALGRTQRVVTVLAEGVVELLEIRWQGLRDIRLRDDAFRRHVEALYRARSLQGHLRETPLFRHLRADVLDAIADQTLFETYGNFDWHASYKRFAEEPPEVRLAREPVVVAEGDYPDGLLLIRSGFGRVTQHFNHGERTLRYLGRGGVFGLDEILRNWETGETVPLQTTLRAVGYTDILRVPTVVIEQHVLNTLSADALRELRNTLTNTAPTDSDQTRAYRTSDAVTTGLDPELLEMLVDYRYINGTAAMVINLDRCVRCDACVEACAKGHDNNPRFTRHGHRFGPVMVANACMHCVDPVCMIGCPTGAIHRSDSGGQVLINDDTCIGCATCANSCPYDNIRMVEVRTKSGQYLYDQSTQQPIRKATKCDLCVDQPGGPACQRACPHDALARIDLRDLPRLAEWVNR
ncbi:MAG: cyclic nucleotide-binding domain-containing protein [Betaproteobacteria bacterium]